MNEVKLDKIRSIEDGDSCAVRTVPYQQALAVPAGRGSWHAFTRRRMFVRTRNSDFVLNFW